MIYKHKKFGDDKHISLKSNGMGKWTMRIFSDRIHRQLEKTLTSEEKLLVEEMLKETGWE